jgi:hypothetical protein
VAEISVQELMGSMSRIPADPIPSEAVLREMLIEQILSFQSRYEFLGKRHTKESLGEKPNSYLERLCNMQLLGITTSRARDLLINGR